MKIVLPTKVKHLLASILSILIIQTGLAQDIPVAVPNFQVIPEGSLIIPMDNDHQQTTTGLFNLKAYGFVVDMLNHSVPLKWAIRANKIKDGIDFTALAERVLPSTIPSAPVDFRSGPIIVLPSDTAFALSRLSGMNDSLPASQQISIYRLSAPAAVDVRYDLTHAPLVGILNGGSFSIIHVNYLTAAGITEINYDTIPATAVADGCYTILTDPHVDAAGTFMDTVRNFVLNGGNFLAQCHAVQAYENSATFGHYHTTAGIQRNNISNDSNVVYPNADMSFSQFQGQYTPNQDGNTRLWQNVLGSVNQNNFYSVVGNSGYPQLTAASVSKMLPGIGGLVFYIGNHQFDNLNDMGEVNGIRMYLNAVLTPSNINCNYAVWWLLPVELFSFDAKKKSNTQIDITWTTGMEDGDEIYTVEKSYDGKNFTQMYRMGAKGSTSVNSYVSTDMNARSGWNYYRLKIENNKHAAIYSEVAAVRIAKPDEGIVIFPNPATGSAWLTGNLTDGEKLRVSIIDMAGRKMKQMNITASNKTFINLSGLAPGLYWVSTTRSNHEEFMTRILIQR